MSPRGRDRTWLAGALVSIAVVGCQSIAGIEAWPSIEASRAPLASPTALELVGPTGPTEIGRVVDITDGDTVRIIIDGIEHRLSRVRVSWEVSAVAVEVIK